MDRSASCGSRAFYLDWRPASALKKKGCSTANQEAVPNPTEHSLETIYDAAANDIFGFWSHRSAGPPQREGQRHCAPIIYLVDDDPSFLRAWSRRLRTLDYQVETFGSAEQFLARRPSDAPACVVLDLQIPGPGGLGLQEALAQAEEPLPVVFVTAHGDVSSSVRAMKQGAIDFLTKPVQGDELLDAVRRALARDGAAREMRRRKREWSTRYESLTSREREVFALVVRGLPNKQIAEVLGISERTVKAHRAQVMHKMGVQSGPSWGVRPSGSASSSGRTRGPQ